MFRLVEPTHLSLFSRLFTSIVDTRGWYTLRLPDTDFLFIYKTVSVIHTQLTRCSPHHFQLRPYFPVRLSGLYGSETSSRCKITRDLLFRQIPGPVETVPHLSYTPFQIPLAFPSHVVLNQSILNTFTPKRAYGFMWVFLVQIECLKYVNLYRSVHQKTDCQRCCR